MEPFISRAEIRSILRKLAGDINRHYRDIDSVVVIGVLSGAIMITADLVRMLVPKIEIDFLIASSYGRGSTKTSGSVKIVDILKTDIRGRHVLLVEDVFDSGLTFAKLRRFVMSRMPASFEAAVLLDKSTGGSGLPHPFFVGKTIPHSAFVIGYGMDGVDGFGRNLPDIWTKEQLDLKSAQ